MRQARASPEKHCDRSCPKCGRVYLIVELLDIGKDVIEAKQLVQYLFYSQHLQQYSLSVQAGHSLNVEKH